MKKIILLNSLILLATISFSQYGSNHNSTMAMQRTFNDANRVLTLGGTSLEIWKGKLVITLNDESCLTVKATMKRDSSGYYIKYRDKEVDKSDSESMKKITPAQAVYLKSKNATGPDSLVGKSNDSCWIFPIVRGRINLYTTIPTSEVNDYLVTHIQKDDGPILKMSYAIVGEFLRNNEGAYNLYMKNKITKAVTKFNKSSN